MTRLNWFSFLNTIAGQLLILLFVAMGIFVFSVYVTIRDANDNINAPPVSMFSERQLGIAEILSHLPVEDRPSHVAFLEQSHPDADYALHAADFELPEGVAWNSFWPPWLHDRPPPRLGREGQPLPQDVQLAEPSVDQARFVDPIDKNEAMATVFFRLEDGQIFSVSRHLFLNPPMDFAISAVVRFIILLALLMIWAYVSLVRPLRKLARVTDTIAKNSAEPQPVEINGPGELRTASHALNKMQNRIHQLIEDRTRMLAAVGHDLRTPVTRLRLRIDAVEAGEVKDAMLRDATMMDGLLSRLMTYFRKGEAIEDAKRFELSSLINSVVDEWSDAGHDVQLLDTEPCRMMARSHELLRLIDNIVDNAVKYAGGCSIRLRRQETHACLQVIDHGPGIAERDKIVLQEPFARGDEARTMDDTSGFGLGLAIARQAVVSHDAEMDLLDTPGGGLTVQIRFPLID